MYFPIHFTCDDRGALAEFLNTYSFGILLSQFQEELASSHLAKATPQWKARQETPSVDLIFHGPMPTFLRKIMRLLGRFPLGITHRCMLGV